MRADSNWDAYQILYQPISGEFGLFGYGGGAAHATGPWWPVLGGTLGGVLTTPMDGLNDDAGGFVGQSLTVGPGTVAYDEGVTHDGPLTGVNAWMAGPEVGTPHAEKKHPGGSGTICRGVFDAANKPVARIRLAAS